ncbi:MAG TPA: hypothetical protein VLK25_12130 [Allosphingosinicella sp.]|nr:hypothetical protein [Allosphingosinicella sp.]
MDAVVGVEIDQTLMLRLAQTNVPAGNLQIARIEWLRQQPVDALIQHNVVPAAGKLRVSLKESLHRRAAIEPTAGIAFQRLTDD